MHIHTCIVNKRIWSSGAVLDSVTRGENKITTHSNMALYSWALLVRLFGFWCIMTMHWFHKTIRSDGIHVHVKLIFSAWSSCMTVSLSCTLVSTSCLWLIHLLASSPDWTSWMSGETPQSTVSPMLCYINLEFGWRWRDCFDFGVLCFIHHL